MNLSNISHKLYDQSVYCLMYISGLMAGQGKGKRQSKGTKEWAEIDSRSEVFLFVTEHFSPAAL